MRSPELDKLRQYRLHRDVLAQRLGAAVIELSAIIRRTEAEIEESLAAETALERELLQRLGIPAGTRAAINRETGAAIVEGLD
jgi:hypothetical protein